MSTNYNPTRREYGTGDRRWARNFLALDTHGVTLKGDAWPVGQAVPSGTAVALDGDGYGVPASETATAEGLLVNDWRASDGDHLVAVAHGGTVDRRYLPDSHAAAVEDALPAIKFIN